MKKNFFLFFLLFFIKLNAQQKDTIFLVFDKTCKNQQKITSYYKEKNNTQDSFKIINYTVNINDTEVLKKNNNNGELQIRGGADFTGRFGSITFQAISNKLFYDSLINSRAIEMLKQLNSNIKKIDSSNIVTTQQFINNLKFFLKNQAILNYNSKTLLQSTHKIIKLCTIKSISQLLCKLGKVNLCVFIIDVSEIKKNIIVAREVLRMDFFDSGNL